MRLLRRPGGTEGLTGRADRCPSSNVSIIDQELRHSTHLVRLKQSAHIAENRPMTASTAEFFADWTVHPIGKVTRALIAVVGVIVATLVLLLASLGAQNVWILILVGIALAGTSVRAAMNPSAIRLATLAVVLVAVPIASQII